MRRILVGVDGSDAAAEALGWTARLAHLTGAEVVAATAFRPDQAEVPPERYAELRDEAEHRLKLDWSEPLREHDVRHRLVIVDGAPDSLLEVAESEDVDLVVVGPRGHGGFAALHIGSLAHHLTHHTRRPLAIVPAPGSRSDVQHIVVGVDGSPGSAAAVRWCTDLAKAASADVSAVYAFEPLAEWVPESDPTSWRHHAEQDIDEWVAPLRSSGVAVRTSVVKDIHPVAALEAAVIDGGADLAVVGTRGLGGFSGLRLGRVPLQLVHHTQIPVVLVPAPTLEAP